LEPTEARVDEMAKRRKAVVENPEKLILMVFER
jgi:hypothetical protein